MMLPSENGENPNFGQQSFFHEFYLYWLEIVLSYHPKQFTGKLANQTSENSKKPDFGLDFGPFGSNLGLPNFVVSFTSTRCLALLQAIIICNFKEN